MSKYGQYNEDGSVKSSPTECILSGKPLTGAYVTGRVKGTNYFYQYLSKYGHQVTPELREQWVAGTKSIEPTSKKDKS